MFIAWADLLETSAPKERHVYRQRTDWFVQISLLRSEVSYLAHRYKHVAPLERKKPGVAPRL